MTEKDTVIASIRGEYRHYRTLAEGALAQLDDAALYARGGENDNPIANLVLHLAGNLTSRFTDFLASDGEKPWRDRDREFEEVQLPRAELMAKWERGWAILSDQLGRLSDADLGRTVTIRGQPLTVLEALHRSVTHAAYHAGQIVLLAKAHRGDAWRWLSIPKGGSQQYNANPDRERPPR